MSKIACVTGAASGIGLAIAKKLFDDGYKIAIVDLREELDGNKIANEIGEGNLYIKADISLESGRQFILENIKSNFGKLDLLVNNAGVAPKVRLDILETTEESYDRVMNINLKGTFFLTQLLSNYMIEGINNNQADKPKIVNIASMSSYTSSTARAEYCISKAGISMVTTLFADRLSEFGINVYEIRPGIIKTPMTDTVTAKYDKLIFEDNLLPIKRWGFPEDIAAAVSAIASGSFNYSTGQVFDIDGGFHIQRL
jgi:3-oxoacyl-[acyl-carrier protein] reductase